MKGTFVNPYTDYGFKRIFGTEANKNLLVDFLNQLLPLKHQIKDLSFINPEQVPNIVEIRKAIFDISCVGANGDHFTVEMQKAKLRFFKDRSLFYITFPIQSQAIKGEDWDFKLSPVYLIGILNFEYTPNQEYIYINKDFIKAKEEMIIQNKKNKIHNYRKKNRELEHDIAGLKTLNKRLRREDKIERNKNKIIKKVQLKDEDNIVFYDKLLMQFVQMPLFNKKEDELETQLDKWLFFLKHLPKLSEIPKILNVPVFRQAFETARVANFSKQELKDYRDSYSGYCEVLSLKKEVREQKEAVEIKNQIIKIKEETIKKKEKTIEEKEKTIETERKRAKVEREKAKAEREKAKAEREKAVVVMLEKSYSEELIHEILSIPYDEIKIIKLKIDKK